MKKLTFLSLSVAVALAGCGSDDSDNSTPSVTMKTITGFDGYFKNAVMFIDNENFGELDLEKDTILGLTDENGQVNVEESQLKGVIALQTLTVGGDMQQALVAKDPETYAGVFTIDMDHPAQAMQHEVVFNAPQGSDVISPITDLVALEMSSNADMTQEEAELTVSTALGGTEEEPINLYADFVEGEDADAELHKTAQILTESKAENPAVYQENATLYAETATLEVEDMSEEQVNDDNYKPVIDSGSDDTFVPVIVTNSKMTVDKTVFNTLQKDLTNLDIEVGGETVEHTSSIAGLFTDADQTDEIKVTYVDADEQIKNSGLTISIDGNELHINAKDTVSLVAGNYTIALQATDVDSKGQSKGTVYSDNLSVTIVSENQAPVVVDTEETRLQQEITNNWSFTQGEAVENTTLEISALFHDTDSDELEIDIDLDSITGVSATIEDALITLTGTPSTAGQIGTLTVSASDGNFAEATAVDFELPVVAKGNDQSESHPLEGSVWYVLERGSSDGDSDDSNNYSRVWCDSIYLKEGIWYFNSRTTSNRTQCTEPDYSTGTPYEIIDNAIVASFEEDGEAFQLILNKAADSDNIATGAVTVTWTEEGEGSRYVWFKNKADAEARIKVESQFGAEERFFAMDLPGEEDFEYHTGYVSISLEQGSDFSGSSELFDADISFDLPGRNFDCDTLDEFYDSFYISGINAQGSSFKSYSSSYMGNGFECFTNEENDVTYAGVDFDIHEELVKGNVYSFIGKLKDDQAIYLEGIKFNVTWTGEGNDE
ncbi:hypothetical protein [Vibrio sp.]|uniref:hypothetical protein n=1 Tax=Vibrio sp. TaxID=678 RepID=UPI0037AFE90F